ncbi:MAG: reverse transcriptase domain-containing protein [Acidimicrobiales bacterium]
MSPASEGDDELVLTPPARRAIIDRLPEAVAAAVIDFLTTVLIVQPRTVGKPLRDDLGGTPQGSAVSPVLANLFMHFAFDRWMEKNFPSCPFERYADDAVVHCATKRQAEQVLAGISRRMEEVGLSLHPDKTRIVYCKDDKRRGSHEHTKFTFLGFEFRARPAKGRDGRPFVGFLPAISPEALTAKGADLRKMRIHRRTDLSLDDLARWLNRS